MGSCYTGDQALPRITFSHSTCASFATRQREAIHYLKQMTVPELVLTDNGLFRRRMKAYTEAH